MISDIEKTLTEYIQVQIFKRQKYALAIDDPLISNGQIDSFHLVDLAIFIEERYEVQIDDTDLNAQTFDTIAQLAQLVEKRLGWG